MMLKIEQLCVDIAGVKVLRDISATLQAGTTVAVVGAMAPVKPPCCAASWVC